MKAAIIPGTHEIFEMNLTIVAAKCGNILVNPITVPL